MLTGPILIIEDDSNDLDVMTHAIKENGFENEVMRFLTAKEALEYLLITKDQPFIILCDIHMQVMNGLEFRNVINKNELLRRKSIPFIFFTGVVSPQIVYEAYDLTVQGFFEKPGNYENLKTQMHAVINYWRHCLHPNNCQP